VVAVHRSSRASSPRLLRVASMSRSTKARGRTRWDSASVAGSGARTSRMKTPPARSRRNAVAQAHMVNPDCIGSMTLFILPFAATAELDFVIDDDGDELRVISTGTGNVETREYKKQFSRDRKD
jgi:hypothetical protein